MNDKDLIKAYKNLKNSEAPDLWNRIEKSIDTASSAEKVNGNAQAQPVLAHPDKILPLKKYNKLIFSSAAVILVVLVAVAVTRISFFDKSSFNAADNSGGSFINSESSQSEEKSEKNFYADLSDTVSYDMPKAYKDLKLADIQPVRLPTVTVSQSPQTKYFTIEAFADTGLLVQATVQNISFIYNNEKEAHSVVYTVLADNIYYSSADYPTSKLNSDGSAILTIISPIVQADDVWMYPLQVNRTYILPLTVTDNDTISLVFPYAPQIELSLDGFCVFHSGWQVLIDGNTGFLSVDCIHPDDYFYDRMMIRQSSDFVRDLTCLIESLKK